MKQLVKDKLDAFIKWFDEIKVQIPLDERKELIKAIKAGLK